MHRPIQHGEILLQPVSNMPAGSTQQHTSFIVGHSETGHHHVVESDTQFAVWTDEAKQELYLQLFEPAKLVHKKIHDKHRTITLQPTIYKVLHKKEYDPWSGLIREVKD